MNLEEIEAALDCLKFCPKCGSNLGFWVGVKGNNVEAQCKRCAGKFELQGLRDERDRQAS